MQEPRYSDLEPLIAGQTTTSNAIEVTFRCPRHGVEHVAKARVEKDTSIAGNAARTAKKGLWQSLQRTVSRSIASSLGSGIAGRVAKEAAGSAMKQQQAKTLHSAAEIEAAVLLAFASVRDRFAWDDGEAAWVAVEGASTS